MHPLRALLVSLLLLPGLALAAPGAVKKGAVSAELVAHDASIQPGHPFLVALRLVHEEHWHSYWLNAGTGYPTSLTWKLPEGFTAGDIQWPTPHVVKDTKGIVTGHGYEGEVFLFVEITPPKDLAPGLPGFRGSENPGQIPGGQQAATGQTVTLAARADWLMCKDVCMPGDAKLELTLPVKAEPPGPNMAIARLFNNARAQLPVPLAGWTATAARDGASVTLRLTPAAGNSHRPTGLHLFDNAGLLDYAAPQKIADENGVITFTLALAKDAPADATRLAGLISSENGWGGMIPSHGATFDVAFGGAEATSNVQHSTSNAQSGSNSDPQVSGFRSQVSPPASGLAGTLLLALVGGLILNLMPCVFPVLGIKVLGFVNQSGSDRGKVITHGLVFTLGVLLSFWTLAGLLLALRAGGAELGWGFQLQSSAFVFGMAVFLLAFALNLSGLFEVGLSATGVGGKLQMQSGYGGSFFTGILATLVATPCSAPFLAPALGAALTLSAVESILVFTAIGVGLSAPYLLLSAFPAAVKLLPRPGAWMETFKQLMAFPLYATVGWLLWVLAGQTKDNDSALLLIVFGLVLVAMAAWVYGRWAKPAGRVVAALLLLAGLSVGWPRAAAVTVTASGYAVKWEHWSPEAVAAARTAGRTVYVDFTARWCATCQTNKAAVFTSRAVLAELAQRNVLLLKADWTSKDPAITAELAKWHRSAVPFNLIYAPGAPEPIVLPELLTPGIVLEKLAEAK